MTFKCRLEPQNYFNLISITLITIYKIINSVYYQITVKTYQQVPRNDNLKYTKYFIKITRTHCTKTDKLNKSKF